MDVRWPAVKAAAVLTSVVFLVSPCCGAGVDSWERIPSTVKKFQRALSSSFSDRTSLLLGNRRGVAGGTGSVDAHLLYISCTTPVSECFPPVDQGEYVAVVEEQQLPALLKMISPATGGEGSPVSNIPQSIITLPATESVPFAPGPSNPLSSYYQQNESQAWNPTGLDLVDLSLPCGVFLAPANLAQEYREQAQHNNRRGLKGPTYGASVALKTQMTLQSDSVSCVSAQRCLPLGGYSVWAAVPPFQSVDSTSPPRKQVVVMSHWDSRSLFRYMAKGTHGALSGLIAMLVAVDIIRKSRELEPQVYSRDLIFLSLSGEAYDLIGSRQLLYNLHTSDGPHDASVAGLNTDSIAALVEVGMLGHHPGVVNDTISGDPPRGEDLSSNISVFLHQAGPDELGVARAFAHSAGFGGAPVVSNSSREELPPCSLLAWHAVMPDVSAVHFSDFDVEFHEDSYWSYKDVGLRNWSRHAVAKSAILLARTLHYLASDSPMEVSTINLQEVTDLTDELFDCLAKPGGLQCGLVQSMTGTHTFSSADRSTAEQYIGVLRELPSDDQSRAPAYKKNIERFVWEFLANRTYEGTPHDVIDRDGQEVGCDNNVNTCSEQEVCLHVSGNGGDQGQCVRAEVRYTPAYPTNLRFKQCSPHEGSDCTGVWELIDASGDDQNASAWAQLNGLPSDPMWTETFNEDVSVTVNLREQPLHDAVLLACGIVSTILVTCVVTGMKALHRRQKLD